MSTLVLKFGGTSVGTVELIKSAAQIIKKEYDKGHNVAVVVSAMSGTTNALINFVNDISTKDDAEYDAIVSSAHSFPLLFPIVTSSVNKLPPNLGLSSAKITLAPFFAADSALAKPEGPEPAIKTSQCSN